MTGVAGAQQGELAANGGRSLSRLNAFGEHPKLSLQTGRDEGHMAEFLIERIMPGVARLSVSDLKEISRLSFKMLLERFPTIHWLQSYATDDILYCVYRAPSEQIIREYARESTLPVHRISQVRATIDPTTIEDADQERAAARQRLLEHARFCRHLAKNEQDGRTKTAMLDTAALCEEAAARTEA